MPESSTILRPFWSRLFNSLWAFGLVLIFVWGVPRFVIVLMANTTGDYRMVSIIFMSMWIAPWVFLSKHGRRSIGLVSPTNISWLFFGLILGAGLCAVMMMVATFLYDNSISNWFVYISNSYSNVPDNLTASDKQIYFIIYSIIGMLFSPIGEELFYRGIVHTSFISKFGARKAAILDSGAFALTHLAHFGIIYNDSRWDFLLVPSLLWVAFIFFTGLLFNYIKKRSGSLLGAVISHAGFNLAMTYFIFYYIL